MLIDYHKPQVNLGLVTALDFVGILSCYLNIATQGHIVNGNWIQYTLIFPFFSFFFFSFLGNVHKILLDLT